MTVTQKIGRVYYGWWNAAASFVCLMLDYRLRDIPHFARRSEHQPALGSLHREGSRPRCRACSSSFQRYVCRRRVRENRLWLDLRQGLHSRYSGLLHSAGHWHIYARGIQGLTFAGHWHSAFPVSGLLTALVFSLVRGSAHGGLLVQKAIFAKHCFGPTQLGKLIGILTAVASVGYAVGPWAVGWMYDQHGTYRYAFASLIGLSIASATLLTWVQPTYRNQLVRGA